VKVLEALLWSFGNAPKQGTQLKVSSLTAPLEPENNEVSSPACTSWKGKGSGINTPKRFNVT